MSEKITNITKNTSYYTFALIMQKVVSFTYFAILARNLSLDSLGKYYFAVSFTTIFGIFIDVGLFNVLTREVARRGRRGSDSVQSLFSTVLAIKIPLAVVSVLIVVLLVNIFHYSEIIKTLVYISAISMVLDSFAITFYGVMRGFHNLKFESFGVFVFQLIIMVVGLTALYFNLDIPFIMMALAIASIFSFSYTSSILLFKYGIKIIPKFDFITMKKIGLVALPFAIFAIMQKMYMYLDTVLLQFLAGDEYVGLYQAPFKIIFALQFLPMAFTASLYPAFSTYWKSNKKQLPISFTRAINYLIIISLPISGGVIVLSNQVMNIFKSQHADAILSLQIIISSIVFIFLNFPIGSLLNACDRQKINTKIMAIGLVISIVLNLLLIPNFQIIGASITVFATNLIMFVLGVKYVHKIIAYKVWVNLAVLIKTAVAVAIMCVFATIFKNQLHIIVNIMLSGIIYLFFLFILGGVTKEDIRGVISGFTS